MASVYRIRKEACPSGVRCVVDYRDNTGRRSTRRFKRARDAEAFKKQVEASTYTGLLPRAPSMSPLPNGRRSGSPGRKPSARLVKNSAPRHSGAGVVT
jgi:hypothetical protein